MKPGVYAAAGFATFAWNFELGAPLHTGIVFEMNDGSSFQFARHADQEPLFAYTVNSQLSPTP